MEKYKSKFKKEKMKEAYKFTSHFDVYEAIEAGCRFLLDNESQYFAKYVGGAIRHALEIDIAVSGKEVKELMQQTIEEIKKTKF